jgi:uncharacterized repeat protein (TIGR02543 family)
MSPIGVAIAETQGAEQPNPAGNIVPLANSEFWMDEGTEYKYRSSWAGQPTPVSNWGDLKAALNKVGAFEANKPYVILISGNIDQNETYTMTDKNIVLRKYDSSSNIEQPCDYTQPWDDINAASPDLYDGEADFFITQTIQDSTEDWNLKRGKHFVVLGTDTKLVLENISLAGSVAAASGGQYPEFYSGGIHTVTTNFTFAGNIVNCSAYTGGVFSVGEFDSRRNQTKSLEVLGGVFANNKNRFGTIQISPGQFEKTVLIKNAIVESGYASNEAGGVYIAGVANATIENTIIRNCEAWRGPGGIVFLEFGNLTLRQDTVIEGCQALNAGNKGNSAVYPGNGGAIEIPGCMNETVTLNIEDGVRIVNNSAVRGGGGIAIGTLYSDSVTLNLNGGEIFGNVCTGEYREASSNDPDYVTSAIGQGGGIYAGDRTKVKIPANSTVSFADNEAPFITLTPIPGLGSGGTLNDTINFPGDDYTSHIKKIVWTSVLNSPPFNALYNNYDINALGNSYAQLFLASIPADGSGGTIQSNANQQWRSLDIFGDGRQWSLLTSSALTLKAAPQPGYVFTGWAKQSDWATNATGWRAWSSSPGLRLDEWAHTVTFAGDELYLLMPPVDVTLVATFVTVASLSIDPPTLPVEGTGYTPVAPQPIIINNGGESNAANVTVSLTGPGAGDFTLTGSGDTVPAAGDISTWFVAPKDGLPEGVHTVTVEVSYDDGSGNTVTTTEEVTFIVSNGSPAPYLKLQPLDVDFGTVLEGATVPNQTIGIRNIGNADATISNVSLSGSNASAFEVVGVSGGPIASGAQDSSWQIRLKPGATPGNYDTQLVIEYDNGLTATGPVKANVVALPVVTVDDTQFASEIVGYAVPPSSMPIVITNAGVTPVTIEKVELIGSDAASFNLIDGASQTVPGNGDNRSYSVSPILGLSPGLYSATMRVTYHNGASGGEVFDAVVEFVVLSPPTVPGDAQDLDAQVPGSSDPGRAVFSWDEPIDDGGDAITDYGVQVSDDGGQTWSTPVYTGDPNIKDYEFTGLDPDSDTYIFRVWPINSHGDGASAEVTYHRVTVTVSDDSSGASSGSGIALAQGSTSVADGSFVKENTSLNACVSASGADFYRYTWSENNNVSAADSPDDILTVSVTAPTTVHCLVLGFEQRTVHFDSNGGNGSVNDVSNSAQAPSYAVTLPDGSMLSLDGYDFVGWNSRADGTGDSYMPGGQFDMAGTDTTLYAQWSLRPNAPGAAQDLDARVPGSSDPGNATFTWDEPVSDGGDAITDYGVQVSDDGGQTWSTPVYTGDPNTKSYDFTGLDPDSDTYIFRVWPINSQGDGRVSEVAYHRITATVADDAQGVSSGATVIVSQGSATVDSGSFVREGTDLTIRVDSTGADFYYHTWIEDGVVHTASTTNGSLSVSVSDPTAIHCDVLGYEYRKVHFDGNASAGSLGDITNSLQNPSYSVLLPDGDAFVRTGYSFVGWNTRADGTGDAYGAGDEFVMTGSDTTLYAQWAVNPSNPNPGTPSNPAQPVTGGDGSTAGSSNALPQLGDTLWPVVLFIVALTLGVAFCILYRRVARASRR